MKNADWIDARSACAELGIKPQTLYAYVSRHQIRAETDPKDARQSLYSRRDIAALAQQKRRPRARADVAQAAIRWGEPVLPTAISEVRDGTIFIRGQAIEDCAQNMTLEQVAMRLCDVRAVICPATQIAIEGKTPFSRAMKALALDAETAVPPSSQSRAARAREVGRLIGMVADACLGECRAGPVHERVALAWGLNQQGRDLVRRALVLLSDHELNPSTFAVRVCASTGGSLSAALLSGMATLSGPRHGGAGSMAAGALRAEVAGGFDGFLKDNNALDAYAFGFGHPLYPDGDPRAAHLLMHIPARAPAKAAVRSLAVRLSTPPNIDAALAVFADHFGCPDDAAATIFAIGRVAGWIAHATEQSQSGTMIRPRAKFVAAG